MDDELFAFAAGLDVGVRETSEKAAEKKIKKTKKAHAAPHHTDDQPGPSDRAAALRALADAGLGADVGHGDARRRIEEIAAPRRVEVVAPLPSAGVREKEDRAAAYHATVRDAAKWAAVMRRNRSSEPRVFGRTPNAERASTGVAALLSGEAPPASFASGPGPSSLAAAMSAVLARAGLQTEEQQLETERRRMPATPDDAPSIPGDSHDASAGTLGDDEDARIAMLAKRRALVLWTEQKRRQQARIKSKTFRKHVRRENAAKAARAAQDDGDAGADDAYKADLARAKERATLQTRKVARWASAQLSGRRALDSRVRDDAMAQVREKERLRQEIYGRAEALGGEDDESAEAESDSESDAESQAASDRPDEVDALFDAAKGESDDEAVGRRAYSGTHKETHAPNAEGASRLDGPIASRDAPPVSDEQLALVREAFEGDDVFEAFAAHKAAVVEAEAPRLRDETLPGWGTWAGASTPAPAPRVLRREPGTRPADRRDAGLANVVIRERTSKRAAGLLALGVPFGFGGSRDAYEAEMARPIGPEWTSATEFARRIRPRITLTPGFAIPPARPADAEAEL